MIELSDSEMSPGLLLTTKSKRDQQQVLRPREIRQVMK